VTEIWVIMWIRIDWGVRCCIHKVEMMLKEYELKRQFSFLSLKKPKRNTFSQCITRMNPSIGEYCAMNTANLIQRCQSGINNRHIQCANLVVLIASNHNYALSIIDTCYNIQSIPISTQNSQQHYEYKLYQCEHCKTPSAFT